VDRLFCEETSKAWSLNVEYHVAIGMVMRIWDHSFLTHFCGFLCSCTVLWNTLLANFSIQICCRIWEGCSLVMLVHVQANSSVTEWTWTDEAD